MEFAALLLVFGLVHGYFTFLFLFLFQLLFRWFLTRFDYSYYFLFA